MVKAVVYNHSFFIFFNIYEILGLPNVVLVFAFLISFLMKLNVHGYNHKRI